jgi:hypothetical protein
MQAFDESRTPFQYECIQETLKFARSYKNFLKVSVSETFLLTFGTTGGYTPIESKISPQEGG